MNTGTVNKTIFIGDFDSCTCILAYNSKLTKLIPNEHNLFDILFQLKVLQNSSGGEYKSSKLAPRTGYEELGNRFATIIPSENLGYAPLDGFDTILYLQESELLNTELPIGYSKLGDIVGNMRISDSETIYPEEIVLDLSGIIISSSSVIETEYLTTIADISNLTKKYLLKFKQIGQLDGSGYIKDDSMEPYSLRLLREINLSKIESRLNEDNKYWFGYSRNNEPLVITNQGQQLYSLILDGLSGNELYTKLNDGQLGQSSNCPKRYYRGNNPSHNPNDDFDLFRTGSFAIGKNDYKVYRSNLNTSSGEGSSIDDSDEERPVVDIFSGRLACLKSTFNTTTELQKYLPKISDLFISPVNLLNSKGKLFVICSFGDWFLFNLDQFNINILTNSHSAILVEKTDSIYVVNNKTALIRENNKKLYLINSEGFFCTPGMKSQIDLKYPYSRLLNKFTDDTIVYIDESDIPTIINGPLRLYRKNRYPLEFENEGRTSKIVGSIDGLIYVEYTLDKDNITIDYL